MNSRKHNPKIAIVVVARGGRVPNKSAAIKSSASSTTSTKMTVASTVASTGSSKSIASFNNVTRTSKVSTRSMPSSIAATKATSKISEIDDELESMLSLTQTLSFWDGDDDGNTMASSYDCTSYSGDTYESSSSFEGRNGRRGDRYDDQVASCSVGLEDTLETFAVTGRAFSSALKVGSKSMKALFVGKQEQDRANKAKMMNLEEEKRSNREAQLREEMTTARYEVRNVANLWREK